MFFNGKSKIIIAVVVIAAAFAAGRYSVSQKPNIKESEVVKSITQTDERKDTNIKTRTETTKQPSGVVTTVTTTETSISAHKDTDTTVQDTKKLEQTQPKRSKINASLLIGVSRQDPGIPSYGVGLSKEFIGPVTLGAFFLTNGTVGLSIGLDF